MDVEDGGRGQERMMKNKEQENEGKERGAAGGH